MSQFNIDAAMQSYSAAVVISEQTGVAELIREGSRSFSESIVITSVLGGIVMLGVAFLAYKLIPKNLDITEEG